MHGLRRTVVVPPDVQGEAECGILDFLEPTDGGPAEGVRRDGGIHQDRDHQSLDEAKFQVPVEVPEAVQVSQGLLGLADPARHMGGVASTCEVEAQEPPTRTEVDDVLVDKQWSQIFGGQENLWRITRVILFKC